MEIGSAWWGSALADVAAAVSQEVASMAGGLPSETLASLAFLCPHPEH